MSLESKTFREDIKDLKKSLDNLTKLVTENFVAMTNKQGELSDKIDRNYGQLQGQIQQIVEENVLLKVRLILSERQTKEKNLLVIGIPEKDGENAVEAVNEFFVDRLGLTVGENLDSAFRLGKPRGGGSIRPILVRLAKLSFKFEVQGSVRRWRAANHRDERIFIIPDLPAEMREIEKEHIVEARKKRQKVRWDGGNFMSDNHIAGSLAEFVGRDPGPANTGNVTTNRGRPSRTK